MTTTAAVPIARDAYGALLLLGEAILRAGRSLLERLT